MAFFDRAYTLGQKSSIDTQQIGIERKPIFDRDLIRKSYEASIRPVETELRTREDDLSFNFGDLKEALGDGIDQTYAMMQFSLGLASGRDVADDLALHFQNKDSPAYMDAYHRQREIDGKKIDDAKGFWRSMGAWGETAVNILKEPGAFSYSVVENVANFLPSLGTGATFGGIAAVSGGPLAPVSGPTGFLIGMSAGTMVTEMGAKGLELLLEEAGTSTPTADQIRALMNDDDFRRKAWKQGATKGAIIALVDAVTFKAGGKILSAPGKIFNKNVNKEIVDAGVDIADDVAVKTALQTNKTLIERIATHHGNYVKSISRPRRVVRRAGALALESFGEGFGEYTGELTATGEAKPAEALFEALSSIGQSAIQTSIAKASTGTYKQSRRIVQQINTAQIEKVRKGEDSGIKPSDITEAAAGAEIELTAAINEVNAAIDEQIASNIELGEFETLLAAPQENRANLEPLVEGIEEVEGYTDYSTNLRSSLEETFGPSAPLYVAVTSDELATLETPTKVTPTEKPTTTEALPVSDPRIESATNGDPITVYDPLGQPVEVTFDARSEAGTLRVTLPDGTTDLVDNSQYRLQNTKSTEYVLLNSTLAGREVADLSEAELTTATSRVETMWEAAKEAGQTTTPTGWDVNTDLNALRTEKTRRVAAPDKAPTEEAVPEGYIVASSDPAGLDVKPGTTVEEVEVPVENIVARGNTERGQYVARFTGITIPAKPVERVTEEAPPAKPLLDVTETRLGQLAQEEQVEVLEEEFDAGAREVEVAESEKTDAAKLTRSVLRESQKKLDQIPTDRQLDVRRTTKEGEKRVSSPVLGKLITKLKILTESGRGKPTGDRDTRVEDVKHYRKALANPDKLDAVNKVLKKAGYKIARKGKKKEITLVEDIKGGKQFGLGTIRIQDRTIDEYIDLVEEVIIEGKLTGQAQILRGKEQEVLTGRAKVERERALDKGVIAEHISTIEKQFVTRKDGKVQIDDESVNKYVEKLSEAKELKYAEVAAVKRGVQRSRNEAQTTVAKQPTKPAPRTSIIVKTEPTTDIPGLRKIAKLTGGKLRAFHARAASLVRTGTRDKLLGKIADVYVPHAKIGTTAEAGKVSPNTILTLSKTTDRQRVARAYALASMYIFSQPSVTFSLPNNSLDVNADSTSLGGYLRSKKILNDSQFGKLYKEVQRVIGSNAQLIRVSQNEFVIHDDSINKSQLARRLGRLQAKFGETYGFQTEFYTSHSESVTQDWTKDPLGEGIRDQLRNEGFTDLLAYIDSRREAYLNLAQEFGAKTEDLIFKEPVAEAPTEAPTTEATKARASMPEQYKKLQYNDYDALEPDIKAIVDARIDTLDNPEKTRAALRENKGTDWSKQAIEGAIAREALESLIRGDTPSFPSIFDRTDVAGIQKFRDAVQKGGAEVVWTILQKRGIVGGAAKPVNSINSSFLNCEPSKGCAKFCYATKGNYQYVNAIIKGELSDWAVTTNPKRAADMAALEYASMPEFQLDKALRVFDKGDGNSQWIEFIKELNNIRYDNKPIRVQVFSKHPDFLREVPEMNVRLLSIDDTNIELADENPDLGVAYVYTGTEKDNAWLTANEVRFKEQGGVILPVKFGSKTLPTAETKGIPKWARPWICPIDKGLKKIGIGRDQWNCTKCDAKGGIGCFHGQVSKTIFDTISNAREIPYAEQIQKNVEEIRSTIGGLGHNERSDLLAELDALRDAVRGSTDTATETESSESFTNAVDENAESRRDAGSTVEEPSKKRPSQPATGRFFNTRIRSELDKTFKAANVQSLEERGIVKIIADPSELPDSFVHSDWQTAEAAYDPDTEVSYLIASNIRPGEASSVLMHEVGVHFGLRRMLGAEEYARLQMELLDNKENPLFQPYFEQVRRQYRLVKEADMKKGDTGSALIEDSEEFIEEVIAKMGQDPNALTIPAIERLYRQVRVFLSKYFPKINLTVKDVQAVVRGSLNKSMRDTYTAQDIRRDKMMGAFREEDKANEYLYNLVNAGDNVYRDFPSPPLWYFDKNKADTDFEAPVKSNLGLGHLKQARKRMESALEHTQTVFNDLKVEGMEIDFNLNQTKDRGEKFVRIRNADGDMLALRFALDPIASDRNPMLGPVVDFHSITHKNINNNQIDKAIRLLRDGKLKNQHALSTYINWRMGTPPRRPIPGLRPDINYDQWSTWLLNQSLSTYQTLIEKERIAVEQGMLRETVTKIPPGFKGRAARPSMPSESTEGLTPEQEVLITRATGSSKRSTLWDHLDIVRREKFLWFTQGAVDSYRSVRNKLGDEGTRAWELMHLSNNAPGLMHSVLRKGAPVEVTRNGEFDWYDIDKNGKGIIEIMQGLHGEMDRYLTWMVGNRAGQLMREGREKNYTKDDIIKMKALSKGRVNGQSRALLYAKTMKELSRFQSSILDIAVNAGVISVEDRATLATDFYVPFYREFEKSGGMVARGPAMSGDFINIKDVIHKLKGSELEVHDVFHNIIMNWTALLDASMKSRAGTAAIKAAEGLDVATRIDDKKRTAQIAFGKKKARAKKDEFSNFIYILENGERVWYEVHDPMVLQSLLSLNWSGSEAKALKVFSTFKRMFTFGVTASPAFKVRNLIRDAMHSIAVGDMNVNIFANVKEGYKATAKDSDVYWSMLAGGGAFSFGFLHDDPSAIRRITDSGVKEARVLDTPKKARAFLGKGWDAYAEMGNRLENANRAALYMKRVGEVGHARASFEARDLLNFSSHGNWVATQWLISSIGFLNARAQGLDKMGRSVTDKKQRGRMLSVVGSLVLASALYELTMSDDEEYKELPDWKKDTYWPIKIPGTEGAWFFLPKPFEIGAIASIAQRTVQLFVDDTADPAFFAKRTQEILTDQLAFDWRFQVFKPVLEVATNYDSFRDARIESLGWEIQGKAKHLRKRGHTSELSIATSDFFNDIFGDAPISPVQIDHLIKGYFGWLGATTIGLFDFVFYPSEVEPTKRIDQYRGLIPAGSFVGVSPATSTKSLEIFWEQMHDMRAAYTEYRDYLKMGLNEEASKFAAENRELLIWRKKYQKVQTNLGKIGKMMDRVYESRTMTPDDKRERLDELIQFRNDAAKRIIDYRRKLETKDKRSLSVIRAAEASEDKSYDVAALQEQVQGRDQEKANAARETENLYDSVFNAEFESGKRNAFIRTKFAPKEGSSAYGPLQITVGLMKSARDQLTLTEKESNYIERFIEQGNKFLKYGKEPDMEGYESKYDYGGSGDLTTAADKRMYKQVGEKLLRLVWDQSDGDKNRFLTAWRYGEGSGKDVEQEDKRYYKAFTKVFKTA